MGQLDSRYRDGNSAILHRRALVVASFATSKLNFCFYCRGRVYAMRLRADLMAQTFSKRNMEPRLLIRLLDITVHSKFRMGELTTIVDPFSRNVHFLVC